MGKSDHLRGWSKVCVLDMGLALECMERGKEEDGRG